MRNSLLSLLNFEFYFCCRIKFIHCEKLISRIKEYRILIGTTILWYLRVRMNMILFLWSALYWVKMIIQRKILLKNNVTGRRRQHIITETRDIFTFSMAVYLPIRQLTAARWVRDDIETSFRRWVNFTEFICNIFSWHLHRKADLRWNVLSCHLQGTLRRNQARKGERIQGVLLSYFVFLVVFVVVNQRRRILTLWSGLLSWNTLRLRFRWLRISRKCLSCFDLACGCSK